MNKLKDIYLPKGFFIRLYKMISKHPDYIFYKAVSINQKYRKAKDNNNFFLKVYYGMKANRLASKYNLELWGKYGNNLKISHGNIVINSKAVIGDNVMIRGGVCIAEKNEKAPKIGNNVEIGYGTVVIGNIEIADNIIIGANSFVNKSFKEEGVVIAGCPAKIIKKK